MATVPIECERQLAELLVQIKSNPSDQAWFEIETAAQTLANTLRVRDGPVDNHTVLGKTSLPQTLTSVLTLALHGSPIPDTPHVSAVFELLRVAANLCMDHNENRALLLDAGVPQAVVSLLEGYADNIPSEPSAQPLPLSVPHLKIVRTAIGVLLNASIGFDPVKFRLISLEAAMTVLKLSTAIYPPAAWIQAPAENSSESAEDIWILRSGISNWAWRTISELKDVKDETLQVFGPDVLPILIPALRAFSPPYTPDASPTDFRGLSIYPSLILTDFEALEESCTLIESLSLDIEDVRLSLARGLSFPAEHGGVPCLSAMLDFIETGNYSPLWYVDDEVPQSERKRREKAFDICKAAVIKAVVEVSGEERNEEVLWDDSVEGKPGGEFVSRMVDWIKRYVTDKEDAGKGVDRDDLVICATLSLGNLSRRESHAITLLAPPHSLAPVLVSDHLLSPSTDIKIKHGVIALLKHLAQSSTPSSIVPSALIDAGVVQRLATSGVWDEKTDAMAEVVQVGAIGVVKHLCNASVESTFALVLPSSLETPLPPTGLSVILALVRRSDSIPVKSEGTRVLVNAVKSLWSGDIVPSSPITPSVNGTTTGAPEEKQRKRQEAMKYILTPECASALANLVGRSAKYPLLVNEGVVALSLMATQKAAAPLVLEALVSPLPFDTPSALASPPASASTSTSSQVSSPVVATPSTRGRLPIPRRPLDMLVAVLKNVDNPANFPIEVRANVCSLLLQLARNCSGDDLTKVKEAARPILEQLTETFQNTQGKEAMLGNAAKRVLDAWV